MHSFKLTLAGLTLLSGLFCANPLKAMMLVADSKDDFKPKQGYNGWYYGYDDGSGFQEKLQLPWGEFNATGGIFNGQASSQKMVRRWVSDFDGEVRFNLDFLGTSNPGIGTKFIQNILINGESVLSDFSMNLTPSNSYNFGAFAVQENDAIDFMLDPVAQNWQGQFNLEIEIEGKRALDDLVPQQGLIFLKSPNGAPVHVGLLADDTVYEANPDTGVVQTQSFDRFIQGKNHEIITLSSELFERMVDEIEQKLGWGYSSPTDPPDKQKGANGKFTNVGLIEWAAEEAGYEGGEGFIPLDIEQVAVNCLPGFSQYCGVFSALNIYSLYAEASGSMGLEPNPRRIERIVADFVKSASAALENYPRNSSRTLSVDVGTEGLSLKSFENGVSIGSLENFTSVPPSIKPEDILTQNQSQNSISGVLEGVDFIITDPEGRRMGYTSNLGFFNNIPGAVYNNENLVGLTDTVLAFTSSAVDPVTNKMLTSRGKLAPVSLKNLDYCSQNSSSQGVFRFSIAQRLPGEYKIEKRTPTNCTETQTVPEPSAIASLFTALGLAVSVLRTGRRR